MMTLSSQTLSSSVYREEAWPTPGTSWSEGETLQVPANLVPVVSQLSELLALGEGWNSYHARRIRPIAARTALRFLVDAGWDGPLPSVSPTPSGGVQLEWGADDKGVELHFGPDGNIGVFVDAPGHTWERVASGLEDPILAGALLWARKLA